MNPDGPIDRAFRVLQIVVAARDPLGVREIGRRAGVPRSTASRLVGQLEALHMVSRTDGGQVMPGRALSTLQPGATGTPLLSDRIRPLLVELAKTFGEDAALAIDDGDALLYVAHAPSNNAVSVNDVSGERHAFHLVASGLVAMAQWDQDRLETHLQHDLPSATHRSVTSPASIRKRLHAIHDNGYAWAEEELEEGVNGLALPVSLDGDVLGFISLYGPTYRFSPDLRPSLATDVANLITQRLG